MFVYFVYLQSLSQENTYQFDERLYIDSLREMGDPYKKNAFNVEASDLLPSDREVPDTRDAK